MPPLAPSTLSGDTSGGLLIGDLHVHRFDVPGNQGTNTSLLRDDAAGTVDQLEAEFLHNPIILVQDLPLEQAEALDRIRAPAQIHARLVKLELHAARQEPV